MKKVNLEVKGLDDAVKMSRALEEAAQYLEDMQHLAKEMSIVANGLEDVCRFIDKHEREQEYTEDFMDFGGDLGNLAKDWKYQVEPIQEEAEDYHKMAEGNLELVDFII